MCEINGRWYIGYRNDEQEYPSNVASERWQQKKNMIWCRRHNPDDTFLTTCPDYKHCIPTPEVEELFLTVMKDIKQDE